MEETKIIEINGIKMEVDLRTAKLQRIDTFKVGDHVKLLKTASYGEPTVHQGVIVSFEEFKSLPTVVVLYLKHDEMDYAYLNSNTKHEIIACEPHDLTSNKDWILRKMKDAVTKAELELEAKKSHLKKFNEQFGKFFKQDESDSSSVNE